MKTINKELVIACGVFMYSIAGFAQTSALSSFKDSGTKLYGYKDASSKIVVPATYLSAMSFQGGYATVQGTDKKNGVIDETGKIVIPLKYDFLQSKFSDNLIAAGTRASNGFSLNCGYLDMKGNIAIPFEYSSANTFACGLGVVCKNGKYGCIDSKNKIVIDFKYESINGFYNDWSSARKKDANGKVVYGYLDKKGVEIIPFQYEDCGSTEYLNTSGLLMVKKNGLWGYIDKNNKVVIPFEYTSVTNFSSKTSIVMVKKQGANTYIKIDINGKEQK